MRGLGNCKMGGSLDSIAKSVSLIIVALALLAISIKLLGMQGMQGVKNGMYFNGSYYLLLNKTVNGNFTVSVWLEYKSFNGTGVAISQGIGENEHSLFYLGTGGEIANVTSCGVFSDERTAGNYTAGWRFASVPFVGTGSWHNIVCRYNTTNVSIYVDGVLMNSTATPYAISASRIIELGKRTSTFYLNGTIPTFAYFNGYMSDVQIYNRSLTSSEIRGIYDEGISGAPISGVSIYMPLNSLQCTAYGKACSLEKVPANGS